MRWWFLRSFKRVLYHIQILILLASLKFLNNSKNAYYWNPSLVGWSLSGCRENAQEWICRRCIAWILYVLWKCIATLNILINLIRCKHRHLFYHQLFYISFIRNNFIFVLDTVWGGDGKDSRLCCLRFRQIQQRRRDWRGKLFTKSHFIKSRGQILRPWLEEKVDSGIWIRSTLALGCPW